MAAGTSSRSRYFGLALAAFGVVSVTPDAMLVRYAQSAGGTPGLVLFFKSLFTALFALALVLWQNSCGCRAIVAGVRAAPVHLSVVVVLQMIIQIAFPMAFMYTSAAKALLLIALNPLWAAILGRILLKDKLMGVTQLALILAIASVLVVFLPPLIIPDALEERNATAVAADEVEPSTAARETIEGDLIGIGCGLGLASFLTASRWTAQRRPKANLSSTPLLANSVLVVCLLLAIVDWRRVGRRGRSSLARSPPTACA